MTAVYRAGLGPTFLEQLMLQNDGQGTSTTIVATTDDDAAAAPVSNCYWIREVPGLTGHAFSVGPGGPAITPLGFEWPVCEAHRIEAVAGFGSRAEENVCRFEMDGGGGFCNAKYDPQSDTTFRYRLTQSGGNDAYGSARNTNANYALRWQFDGTDFKMWVDGVLDISIAVSEKPLTFWHSASNIQANAKQYWCGLGWRGSDDEADRPNTTLTIEGLDPDGDNESAEFGDEGTCSDGSGVFGDWLHSGDDSDTSIYLCEEGGVDTEETSTLSALTMSSPKLVVARFLMQANAAKSVTSHCREIDGSSNVIEIQNSNVGVTSWRGYSRPYVLAPDGGAWTQAKVNDLRSGIAIDSGNTANCHMAMQRVEVFGLGDDPPVAMPIPSLTKRAYGHLLVR